MKILMVCLGNICRSPLAEGLLRHKIKQRRISGIEVDSAGTSSFHCGEAPDPRTIANALKHGVDLRGLVARQFSKKDFEHFDKIFVMDESNYRNVLALADSPEHRSKVDLLLNCTPDHRSCPVPDPYHTGEEGFETVFNLLDHATENLLNQIVEELEKNHLAK